MTLHQWDQCYDDSWKGFIVDEAFAHPAKMARGLLGEIFEHLESHYGLAKGSTIVDPFGGIGSTAIIGTSRGHRVICCELEPKFVALAEKNFALHRRTWETFGDPLPVMAQGDSRKLRKVLGAVLAEAVVASPPFAEAQSGGGICKEGVKRSDGTIRGWGAQVGKRSYTPENQGDTEGQLANMPPGSVEAVVGSPPYAGQDMGGEAQRKMSGHKDATGNRVAKAGFDSHGSYGKSDGQLAALPPGSVDGVVSSPPWENHTSGHDEEFDKTATRVPTRKDAGPVAKEYGNSEGQLGNSTGETFWSAAALILAECHAILKPGGVAVWVVKSFVRDGQIVDFPGQWRRLCEHVGFETVEEIHASLVKEESHPSLFGGKHTKRRERKSFFRRLHERKRPDLAIDYEVVWIMRKPAGNAGDVDCLVSSPPYAEVFADQRESRGPGQTSSNDPRKAGKRYTADGASSAAGYGMAPGQLGAMPSGEQP